MSRTNKSYSVIIPSYKRPEMLQRALRSVYEQTILPDMIYLIIDEAEDWERYAFLKEYDSRLSVTFTGGGFGGANARNVGLDLAQEEFVFFLDDDDEWLPAKAEKQIEFLANNLSHIGCTCWNYRVSTQTELVQRDLEPIINRNLSVWNTVGSFSFFCYRWNSVTQNIRLWGDLAASQDWEFYLQLSQYGPIGVLEEPLVNYAAHDGPKISGKPDVKKKALEMVYGRYCSTLSARERCLQRARIHMIGAERSGSFVNKMVSAVYACLYALFAMNKPYSRTVIGRSLATILR